MKKLIINDKGHYLDFPGIPAFRTPVKIDINTVSTERLIVEMRKHGIEDYKIIENDKEITIPMNKTVKKVKKFVGDLFNKKSFDKRMDKMEQLLQQLIDKPTETKTIEQTIIQGGVNQPDIKDEFDDEDDVGFIPTIDTEDMEMTESTTIRKETRDDSVEDAANSLSDLLNNKRK